VRELIAGKDLHASVDDSSYLKIKRFYYIRWWILWCSMAAIVTHILARMCQ